MNAARVVSDREGGFIALDPVVRGQLVTRAPISPPLRLRRERAVKRTGIMASVTVSLVVLALELLALVVARAAA